MNTPTKSKVAILFAAIFVAGIGIGALSYHWQQNHLTHDLVHEAATAAIAFDSDNLRHLTGTRTDSVLPEYLRTKQRLQNLKRVDSQIRYVYLLRARRSAPERVVFLADSNAADTPASAQPGDERSDAGRSSELQSIIHDGQSVVEGPVHDNTGAWVTAYARIGGSVTQQSEVVDLIAIDTAADNWTRESWGAAFRGAFYVWAALGLPLLAVVITRRQGEQREAIRNLSEAVEQSHSAIMILDLDQRVEYVNRGLCQQVGYSRRELIGHHWRELLLTQPTDPAVGEASATIRSGRSWEGEWLNQRKDGTQYPVHGMITPVKLRDGSMACFVAIFDDVSDAKRKEAELREARDLAQAGDRAKGQFLATMSHEVRTPLNGIVGFTSLLLDTALSPEQREYVQTIRASGEALIELTGDILDFARIESGKLKLDPIACDPRECIEEALDLHATRAAEKGIELLHRAAEEVPAAVIVDGGRLRQVLVNLVGNAVKFTERGEVEVTVTSRIEPPARLESSAPGTPGIRPETCLLEFKVRDTGIGIAPDQQARLFKPFSQIDDSSTRRYGGAGLGLAICKNLVNLMGGDIALESQPGQGSIFTFTVRVPIAAPHPPRRALEGLSVGLAIRPGSLRRELVELLESWGAEVQQADNADVLAGATWELALVEVCEHIARDLVAKPGPTPGLPPEKTLALVPISLPSELRSGLRAHFRLLVNRPVHHGPLFAMLSGSRPSGHHATAAPATQFGFRVLVVEDNPVNQRLMERVLTGIGCTHVTAANGREAIEELSRHGDQYDVMLLDLHMPEMDGLSALERIRRGDAGPRPRTMWIIALTADVRPEQRIRGFATGLNDYLTKPLRLPELEAAFRRYRTERLTRKT